MFANFVAASDRSFSIDAEHRRNNLLKFKVNGAPIFLSSKAHEKVMYHLMRAPTSDIALSIKKAKNRILITDDNMATEYKRYGQIIREERTWASLIKRLQ